MPLQLKKKRNRHDGHRKQPARFCFSRNDRRSARSRSAAHSCRDKDHLRIFVKDFINRLQIAFGQGASGFRIAAGSKSGPQLQTVRHRTAFERFSVCIADKEAYVVKALTIHVGNGIPTAAAHAYHFDDRRARAVSWFDKEFVVHCWCSAQKRLCYGRFVYYFCGVWPNGRGVVL